MMLERRSRLGRYEVMDELGIGAMATVYKARNIEDGSPVAIKVPDRRLLMNARALQQFKREGQTLVRLRHPNIVRVHFVGQQNDLPYIVMDYVDGHALAQLISSKGKFSVDEVVEILRPIADALDYSHGEKTFHCDVKPGNIRLYRGRTPVLVDFGIVQTIDGTIWDDGKSFGSVWYMSPEQARGERANGRSDQYSLAVVAYEMLAGHVPFDGDNPYAIALQQRDTQPQFPPEWNPSLEKVMKRALHKDPQQRFASCFEFVRALQAAGHPDAPPPLKPEPKPAPEESWVADPDTDQVPLPEKRWTKALADFATPGIQETDEEEPARSGTREGPRMLLYVVGALVITGLLVVVPLTLFRHHNAAATRSSSPPADTSNSSAIANASMRFFESSTRQPSATVPAYETTFSFSRLHFVNSELNLAFRTPPAAPIRITTSLYDPDNKLVTEETRTVSGQEGSSPGVQLVTWGSLTPGYWKKGMYRSEIKIGDAKVADGSFMVVDGNRPREIAGAVASASGSKYESTPAVIVPPPAAETKQPAARTDSVQNSPAAPEPLRESAAKPISQTETVSRDAPPSSPAPAVASASPAPVPTPAPTPFVRSLPTPSPTPVSVAVATPAALPYTAKPAAPSPSSSTTQAHLIRPVPCTFPMRAINKSVNIGVIVLKVTVGTDGKVRNPRFVQGDSIFRDMASDCVKQWLYAPATLDGRPLESEQEIRLTIHE